MNSFSSFKFQVSSFALGRPLILGHRGSPRELQENTIASFLRALEEGADGVELDVRQTGDGKLVVFHDDSLHPGAPLIEHSLSELRGMARAKDITLNSLEEVMQALAGKGFLNIELKELGTTESAVALARTQLPPASYVFSSFLPTVVSECRRRASDVPAIFITDSCRDSNRVLQILEEADASGIGLWHEALTPALAKLFTSRNVPMFVWTVNDPQEARKFAALNVTGIITDLPADIRSAINEK